MTVLHQDRSEPRVGNGTVIHRGHSYTIFEKVSRNRRKQKVYRNRRKLKVKKIKRLETRKHEKCLEIGTTKGV